MSMHFPIPEPLHSGHLKRQLEDEVCKRAPLVAYEAMECHGGNGYVEEHPMAKLYRQAPLNAIWEGWEG